MVSRGGCGRPGLARVLACGAFALLPVGCGELVSWDERWIFDGAGSDSSPTPIDPETAEPACQAEPLEGYHYAEPPEFWLGVQDPFDVTVSGLGFLVAGASAADPAELRFSRTGALAVAPDGTLVLGNAPALGYAPEATGGQCLVELRVPLFSPPRATSRVDMRGNFDSRAPITAFDVLDPESTSNTSLSFMVFDSTGARHYLDIYFANQGGSLLGYHVLVDGGSLVTGAPGTPVEVSSGLLRFDANGTLLEATSPALDLSFAGGAAPSQAISLSWGTGAGSGGGGYASSTSFASNSEFYELSLDGLAAGAGVGINVTHAGEVLAYYDSGEALPLGTLALARFPREPALAPLGDDWAMTPESGAPQYAAPQSSGRGALLSGTPPF